MLSFVLREPSFASKSDSLARRLRYVSKYERLSEDFIPYEITKNPLLTTPKPDLQDQE